MRIIPQHVSEHVSDTCMKFLGIHKCKIYMLATCRKCFWINNVSFSSTMGRVGFSWFLALWYEGDPDFLCSQVYDAQGEASAAAAASSVPPKRQKQPLLVRSCLGTGLSQPWLPLTCVLNSSHRAQTAKAWVCRKKDFLLRDFLKALETTTAMKRRKISCNSVGDRWVSFLVTSRSLHLVGSVQDSAKVVVSWLLARNCCSLAVVVTSIFVSRWWSGGEAVISRLLRLWDLGDWLGTLESRSFVVVVVSCAA